MIHMIAGNNHNYDSRMRLVLGTAQLGMNYGIANIKDKPALGDAINIVKTAWENGIRFYDTAQAYGDSEEVLGKCFRGINTANDGQRAVISKINPEINPSDTGKIYSEVDKSLKRLGLDQLWGLMLHRESWLEHLSKILNNIILKLKIQKIIKHFGVSVYSPEKAVQALEMDEIDIIQIPFNVFDQRALEYDIFHRAREKNKTVFIRSVYLQGLLLMEVDQIPARMHFVKGAIKRFHDFAMAFETPFHHMALAFVVQKAPQAMVIIGAETPDQVKENADLFKRAKEINLPPMNFLSSQDPQLINPSLWPH